MKSFKQYLLTEASVNKHMEHLADNILALGSIGVKESLELVKDIGQQMSGNGGVNKLTLKFDGAPALWAGFDPFNDKFFVGTKSLFNKNPKVNYTSRDVDENHKGVLADKLKLALKEIGPLWKKGIPIMQGDMMFTKGDVNTDTIDGQKFTTFQPNTLRYAVPADSKLSKKIKSANIGIVFHTTYKGPNLQELSATFGADVTPLKKSKKAWIQDAEFQIESEAFFDKATKKLFAKLESQAIQRASKINGKFIDELAKSTQLKLLINTHINFRVREGEVITDAKAHMKSFFDWLNVRFEKEVDKLKSDKGKEKRLRQQKELRSTIKSKQKNLIALYEFQSTMVQITDLFEKQLSKIKQISTFVQKKPGEFEVVAPEGFVAIAKSGNAVKIVDRLSFSRNNFHIPKTWGNGK